LAIFWASVLQHELNYPASRFTYSRQRTTTTDDGCRQPRVVELLQLDVKDEDVTLYVDMTSGVLTASGKYVYDWFTIKFRQLLENVDGKFARDWVFLPTPVSAHSPSTLNTDDRTRQNDVAG